MIDFHAMTDQELNEWIFRSKGWIKLPFPAVPIWQRPSDDPGIFECWYADNIPDFCNDWAWAGKLEEEGKFGITFDDYPVAGFMQWQVYPNEAQINEDWDGEPLSMSTILPRAISEAYAVMTEKDGEG